MKDTIAEVEEAKYGHGANKSQYAGNPQKHAHVPGFGLVLGENLVISDDRIAPSLSSASTTIIIAVSG